MNKNMRKWATSALCSIPILLAGCATVEPWQKGKLAEYSMKSDRDALATAMAAHIQFSREATHGGEGIGGGGCGCN